MHGVSQPSTKTVALPVRTVVVPPTFTTFHKYLPVQASAKFITKEWTKNQTNAPNRCTKISAWEKINREETRQPNGWHSQGHPEDQDSSDSANGEPGFRLPRRRTANEFSFWPLFVAGFLILQEGYVFYASYASGNALQEALQRCHSDKYIKYINSLNNGDKQTNTFQTKICECGGNGGKGGEVGCCCPAVQPNSSACCTGAAQATGRIPQPSLCKANICQSQPSVVRAEFAAVQTKCSSRLLSEVERKEDMAVKPNQSMQARNGTRKEDELGEERGENDDDSSFPVTILISLFLSGVVIIISVGIIVWQCDRWRRWRRYQLRSHQFKTFFDSVEMMIADELKKVQKKVQYHQVQYPRVQYHEREEVYEARLRIRRIRDQVDFELQEGVDDEELLLLIRLMRQNFATTLVEVQRDDPNFDAEEFYQIHKYLENFLEKFDKERKNLLPEVLGDEEVLGGEMSDEETSD